MSPLAVRRSDDKFGESGRKYRVDSDSESDRQEEDLNEGAKQNYFPLTSCAKKLLPANNFKKYKKKTYSE